MAGVEKLIDRAERYVRQGLSIPSDLYYQLISLGVDAAAIDGHEDTSDSEDI